MSHGTFEPAADAPRLSRDAAVQYFVDGIKPRNGGLFGLEAECFLIDPRTAAPCSFDTIERVLRRMAERSEWEPLIENGRAIGLQRDHLMVTLEPGGQVELAAGPATDLHALQVMTETYYEDLRAVATDLRLDALSMGLHPTADFARLPIIPKARYAVMAPQLEARGRLAHYMMRGTCGWQCTVDYFSEADAVRKLRALYHVTSLVSALFANSPWEQGQDTGVASRRVAVWMETDPARCGLIREVFSSRFGFEDYVEYAFRVPMLFIVRGGRWIAMPSLPFGEFVRRGHQEWYATAEDWYLHLTTLFPEIRLKQYLEIRNADAQRFPWLMALPSLHAGLCADDALLDAACDLTRKLTYDERLTLHHDVARFGMAARCGRVAVHDLVRELLAMARHGLQQRGRDEAHYLDPLDAYVAAWQSPTAAQGLRTLQPADLDPFRLLHR